MSYERMRLLCLFDLPTGTKKENKEYRIFRKGLIENGFTMIQYSVYQRPLPNKRASKKYEQILKKYLPRNGEIRLLAVSEKQYNDMKFLTGSMSYQEEVVGDNKVVVI